jgi:hypothetical protein
LDIGQGEGVGYVGTAVLLLWLFILITYVSKKWKQSESNYYPPICRQSKLVLLPGWKKIAIASFIVFIFSLGYELKILQYSFPEFTGMPAAWISDRINSIYNIRSPGRLATLLSLFLMLEAIRRLSIWCETINQFWPYKKYISRLFMANIIISCLAIIHVVEIAPFLKPVQSEQSYPIGNWTEAEINMAKAAGLGFDVVLIAPGWREGLNWEKEIFNLSYHLGIKSNIFLVARALPGHDQQITKDLNFVIGGDWDLLINEYNKKILFAVPLNVADDLRYKMIDRYDETRIRSFSLWFRRENLTVQ